MSIVVSASQPERPTGLEDVVRSVRTLARTTRGLAVDSAGVLERELAMAIRISEQIRDSALSAESLAEARRSELPARLRKDAHQALDLAADVASVGLLVAMRFFEGFVDEPRTPALTTETSAG